MTTGSGRAPFRVPIAFQGKTGGILPDQMWAIDRDPPIKRLERADATTLRAVLEVLSEMLVQ